MYPPRRPLLFCCKTSLSVKVFFVPQWGFGFGLIYRCHSTPHKRRKKGESIYPSFLSFCKSFFFPSSSSLLTAQSPLPPPSLPSSAKPTPFALIPPGKRKRGVQKLPLAFRLIRPCVCGSCAAALFLGLPGWPSCSLSFALSGCVTITKKRNPPSFPATSFSFLFCPDLKFSSLRSTTEIKKKRRKNSIFP